MKLSDIPEVQKADPELAGMLDWLGDLMTRAGGELTDVGYSFRGKYAELVAKAPDGTCLELRVRRIVPLELDI